MSHIPHIHDPAIKNKKTLEILHNLGYDHCVKQVNKSIDKLMYDFCVSDETFKETIKQDINYSIANEIRSSITFTQIQNPVNLTIEVRGRILIFSLEDFYDLINQLRAL